MQLADAFIQIDLHCISRYTFYILISSCFPWESNPMTLVLQLVPTLYCLIYWNALILA